MSKPIHTAGPCHRCRNGSEIVVGREVIALVCSTDANARLLKAAYNAFDSAARLLDRNAVELAESMQEGEVAALVSNLERTVFLLRRIAEGDHRALENATNAADDADSPLAKVKGGAS